MAKTHDMLNVLTIPQPPCRTVAWRRDTPVSYEQFTARVQAWRGLLERTGGRAFALYHSDAVEFAATLFAAWHAGKTICLPGDSLPGTCANLRASVDGYLGEFDCAWRPLIPTGKDSTAARDHFDTSAIDPEFVGLVLYTSGSTGVAQAIPKKLEQMAAEVATLEKQFGKLLGAADIIATVSHQHIYGLLFNVLWPLAARRTFHARPLSFLEELTLLERDFVLVSSPAHLKRLPKRLGYPIGRRAREIFSSGGALPFEIAQQSKRLLGRLPIEVYGSSETGGIAWRRQERREDEAWQAFAGVEWRIDSEDEVLEIRSPNLPDGNWFRMADRAVPAWDGGFVLRGRVDQIAKIEGKRISLSAIESLLKSSPLVSEVRVVAIEGRRQRVAAFVVLSDRGLRKLAGAGKLAINRALRHLLSESIEPVGLPRLWRYLDSLPVNSQGKTTYAELVALLEHKPDRVVAPRRNLIEKTPQRAIIELIAPRDLLYFDGHFAGRPILPGVVQLDWVIRYGRECFDLPPNFRAVHGLKFHRVIAPEMPFVLELVHEAEKSTLSFKISSRCGTHATGRVLFGAADV
jgi:acyl-coenzyme A synthetase/AMP-(fatty) acid ligase/3-hydroxymyristoyl/3-hydroxydecanoyl-(acyl carrier protein) dehydratase